MDKREDFLWPLRVLCSSRLNVPSQTHTLAHLHLEIFAYDALTPADMSACMFRGHFCCISHVDLQPNHCLWRLGFSCTVGRIQSNLSHLLCCISSVWSVQRVCSVHLSQTCPSLKLLLSHPYLSAQFFLPHILHLPVHLFGSLLSLRSHLAIMLYSSASLFSSLSPAVEIQRANPSTYGIPPPHP